MPKIEVIEFNGVRFGRYPESKHPAARLYFAPGQVDRACGVESLHREVWKLHNGPIPDGWHVHHKDGDTLNNDISNLECHPGGEHLKSHSRTPERRRAAREHMHRIRHLSAAWHGTPEGRTWHSEHAKKAWAKHPRYDKTCEQCSSSFQSYAQHARFCAPKCKAAWRRATEADHETRICAVCDSPFSCDRFKPNRTCSKDCAYVLRWGPTTSPPAVGSEADAAP